MPKGQINLLDIAQRNGDGVYALVEGVTTFAPELSILPAFTRTGITYTVLTRTDLPSGDFFGVGEGTASQKSAWKRAMGSMSLFGAQMRVFDSVVQTQLAENQDLTVPDILTDEAIAYLRGSAIKLGGQIYYGKKNSTKGFAGLVDMVADANVINAGGATNADSSSAWLVYLDDTPSNPQGSHLLIGNNGKMQFRDTWLMQQIVTKAAAGASPEELADVWVNGFASFLGFNCSRPDIGMVQIKNITDAFPLTDTLVAKAIAKVPQSLMQDRSKWKLLMNVPSRLTLQLSRLSIGQQIVDGKGNGAFSPTPTNSNEIEIVPTDSLVATERNGTKP